MIATGAAAPSLRLTRRGRMVVVGFLVFAGGLIWLAAAGGAAATGSGVPPSVYEKLMSQVVVRPGDTLWSIAARAEPRADPRIVVERISDINALPSPEIAVGQRLWVPRD